MKFYKTDIVKMGATALITAFAIIAFNFFFEKDFFTTYKSEPISWADALKLRSEYDNANNPHPLKVKVNNGDGTYKVKNLLGFAFDAKQLNTLIHNNKNLPLFQSADQVFIYFGKEGEIDDPEARDRHALMHVVAVGVRKGKLLIPDSDSDQADAAKSSIYDKADPCPGPGCPRH